MPKFNDPDLDAQKKDLGRQIDVLEQQIEEAPEDEDTSGQEAQLDALEDQMQDLQRQRKAARDTNKANWQAGKKT